MLRSTIRSMLLGATTLAIAAAAQSQDQGREEPLFDRQIDYTAMTSAEITAARREAKRRDWSDLTFCADPGNMPLSSRDGTGFQNRIAEVVTDKMGARLRYFWRPFYERGLTRETFDYKQCEIIIEMPVDYERILTTIPLYRSTYVFATREDADFEIENFDDPDLSEKRVGVFQHSGMREALSRHGVKEGLDLHVLSYNADLIPEKQPYYQVLKVVDGELDVAGVWGPFAGWVRKQGAPIELTPANQMEDSVPLEFNMGFGVQTNDVVLKFALDFAIIEAAEEIQLILEEFGVPLVECAECAASGPIKAHGSYFEDIIERTAERFTTPVPEAHRTLNLATATPDQIMTIEKVRAALAKGADPQTELANAIIASDEARAMFLLDQGAEVNLPDLQGTPPLVAAARNRDIEMMDLLLARGAAIDIRDKSGLSPLHYAVLRNHVPSVQLLAERGANLTAKGKADQTPLSLAIDNQMRWAAQALIEADAPVDEPFGEDGLTPLMVLATQDETRTRAGRVTGGPSVVELAELLVANGADVNATTEFGVTALMIAAAGDHNDMLAFLARNGADAALKNSDGRTALDLAEVNRSHQAAQALRVLAFTSGGSGK